MAKTSAPTQAFFGSVFKIGLMQEGYKLEEKGCYILATDKEGKKILIAKICRMLGILESSVVNISYKAIAKLQEEAIKMKADSVAVAFGVAKYSFENCDVIICELEAWDDENNSFLSKGKKGYYYNYRHIDDGEVKNALLHLTIKIQ